jgi:hypothetical protein
VASFQTTPKVKQRGHSHFPARIQASKTDQKIPCQPKQIINKSVRRCEKSIAFDSRLAVIQTRTVNKLPFHFNSIFGLGCWNLPRLPVLTDSLKKNFMPAKAKPNNTAANLGFEAKLWLAADKLRNNMDAAEYKHVVLGLIFLKYISDAF